MPSRAKPCQTLPSRTKPCQALPSLAKPCQALPSHLKPGQTLPSLDKPFQPRRRRTSNQRLHRVVPLSLQVSAMIFPSLHLKDSSNTEKLTRCNQKDLESETAQDRPPLSASIISEVLVLHTLQKYDHAVCEACTLPQRSYGDHLHPIRLRFHGKPLF